MQTAAEGTKEEVFFSGAATLGIPHNTNKNVSQPSYRAQENAILQPGGTAGSHNGAARPIRLPGRHGVHLLRLLLPGLQGALRVTLQPEGEANHPRLVRPDGPDRRPRRLVGPPRQGRDADPQRLRHQHRHDHRQRFAAGHRRHLAGHGQRSLDDRGGQGRRPRGRHDGEPEAVAEQRAAQPERLGGPGLHRPLLRLAGRCLRQRHLQHPRRGILGAGGLARSRRARTGRPSSGPAGLQPDVLQRGHAGLLQQRRERHRFRRPGPH